MNLSNRAEQLGAAQYRRPLNYDLAGKTLTLTAPDGEQAELFFRDRTTVVATVEGEKEISQYEVTKLDPETYFVSYGLTFRAAVLELEMGIAALSGKEPGTYSFFHIGDSAAELPQLTDEMTGTYVRWVFGCERYMLHEYNGDGTCRCIWSPRTDRARMVPATYIKVKQGVYLVELNRTSPFYTDFPQGFSRVVMLQDYERVSFVGAMDSPATNVTVSVSGYGLDPDTPDY